MGFERKKEMGMRPTPLADTKIATGKQGDRTPLGEKYPFVKRKDVGEKSDE
jgi:hypothetical protein